MAAARAAGSKSVFIKLRPFTSLDMQLNMTGILAFNSFPNVLIDVTHPLVLDFTSNLQLFKPNISSESSYSILGYYVGLYLANAISHIRTTPETFDRSMLIDSIYSLKLTQILGVITGPISDDTSTSSPFPSCNQLIQRYRVFTLENHVPSSLDDYNYTSCIYTNPAYAISTVYIGILVDETTPQQQIIDFVSGVVIAAREVVAVEGFSLFPQVYTILESTNVSQFLVDIIDQDRVGILINAVPNALARVRNVLSPSYNITLIDPIGGELWTRTPFNPSYVNLRPSDLDQIVTFLEYINQTFYKNQSISAPSTVNLGFYFDLNDNSYWKLWSNQLNFLKSYTGFPFSINIVLNLDSINIDSATSSLIQSIDRIDYLFYYTNNSSAIPIVTKKIIENLNPAYKHSSYFPTNKSLPHDIPFQIVLGSPSWLDLIALSITLTNQTKITPITLNPFPSFLYAQYLSLSDPGKAPSDAEFSSYLSGLFIGQSLKRLRPDQPDTSLTGEQIRSAIFDTSVINVYGLKLGPFVTYDNGVNFTICSSGAHSSYVGQFSSSNGTYSTLWVKSWSSCGLDYIQEPTTSAVFVQARDNTPIIVGSVLGTLLLCTCCCIFLVALAVVLFVYRATTNASRGIIQHGPINALFLDKSNADKILINNTSAMSNAEIKGYLISLEKFILIPKNAYLVIQTLSEAGISKMDVASNIVYTYTYHDAFDELFEQGLDIELGNASDEESLFREDSVLASCWVIYSKLIGLDYLKEALGSTIQYICELSERGSESNTLKIDSLEIDPVRIKKENMNDNKENYFTNILHLKLAAQTTFNKIIHTEFPVALSKLLCNVKNVVDETYPDMTSGVVSNFIFLRFICLGIVSPQAYCITTKSISPKNQRFLVLLSKALQNLGFAVKFEKEKFMMELNDFIENNEESMGKWLADVSEEGSGSRMYRGNTRINEQVKNNCLKWLLGTMLANKKTITNSFVRAKLDTKSLQGIGLIYENEDSILSTGRTRSSDGESKETGENSSSGKDDTREI